MRKVLTFIAKFIATIFVILFVVAALLALPLFSGGWQLFSPNLYKHALAEEHIYERFSALASEQIVHSMDEGIMIDDAEGHITFVNSKTIQLLGYEPGALVGQHRMVIIAPEYLVSVEEERSVFTHANNSPDESLNLSISWLSLVVPLEEVKRMSSPSSWASLARSESDVKLIKIGKLVKFAVTNPESMVSFLR